MSISLNRYKDIKNNYCICYFGINKEYLVQLRLLRPLIESKYNELTLYICCSSDSLYIFRDQKRIITRNELNNNRSQLSYVRILDDETEHHPVEKLLKESDVECGPIRVPKRDINTKKCALLTTGIRPVRSLSGKQIKEAIRMFESNKFEVHLNPKKEEILKDYELVVGVENEVMYEVAAEGVKAFLIPTGIGENLFKAMFPESKIIRISG